MKISGNGNLIFMHNFLDGNAFEKGKALVFACGSTSKIFPFRLKNGLLLFVEDHVARRLRDLFKLCCVATKFFFILLPYTSFFIYLRKYGTSHLSSVAKRY